MDSKKCKKCGRQLPLSDFYVHKAMGDGHLNFCKECVRKRVSEHREHNIERIREYDRKRGARQSREYFIEYNKKNPERYKATYLVHNAVRDGRMEKPDTCSVCGGTGRRIEAHHWDYSKPLDVQWVCSVCHKELDKQRRAMENV